MRTHCFVHLAAARLPPVWASKEIVFAVIQRLPLIESGSRLCKVEADERSEPCQEPEAVGRQFPGSGRARRTRARHQLAEARILTGSVGTATRDLAAATERK
jgi:hypothetical protein